MYTERQHHPTIWLRGLRACCLCLVIAQMAAFVAAETGLSCLPLGYIAHFFLLLVAALLFGLLWEPGLTLRVDAAGLAMRFRPWQWRFRYVRWPEIRQLRLLPVGEHPPGARFGRPVRDFTHVYWLTSPHLRVLCVELVNNTQLFVSTERPAELLDFLQHGVIIGRRYVPEMGNG